MTRQVTYLVLSSNDCIDGHIRTHPAWDMLPILARLDLLADWIGELNCIYEADFKAWRRDENEPPRDTESRIARHLAREINRLEKDNAVLRAELAFMKEDENE